MTALLKRIKLHPSYIRLVHWEYWPSYVVYIPISFYIIWLAIKSRSLTFFSASNPGVETGGMYGESKMSVLEKVPKQFIPKTIFLKAGSPQQAISEKLKEATIDFPLIAKPDIGERGFLVEKIDDMDSMLKHLARFPVDFLLQEYLDYPFEYNVLYYRIPGESKGTISSITIKEYLTVNGDGKSTVAELMEQKSRSVLQLERFKKDKPELMQTIPAKGESIKVEPIGNHARGTTFLDGRYLINPQMTATFDTIAAQIPGMFIFRFDAKCKTPESLKTGEAMKFVEINGVGGEPTHIYQPGYSLVKAWGDLLHLWSIIYKISKLNHANGVAYMSLSEGISRMRAYLDYKKKLTGE